MYDYNWCGGVINTAQIKLSITTGIVGLESIGLSGIQGAKLTGKYKTIAVDINTN